MKKSPSVSILTTAYNREKYIAEAIESVLNSTYDDWELIVVDDQSSDASFEIADRYARIDERISVYRNEKNIGDYANRNCAAGYARGKYLKFLDADDKLYKHGLEIMVENMEEFPEAGWGLMSFPTDIKRQFPYLLSPGEAYRKNYFEKQIFHKAPLSSIIKRSVFEDLGGFRKVRHFGDFDLWHRLAKTYPVVLMQHGLVWWRGHDDQENKRRKMDQIVGIDTILCAMEHVVSGDCPLIEEDKKKVYKMLRNNLISKVIRVAKKGNLGLAGRMISRSLKGAAAINKT